jgi:hypothetical protein
MNHECSEVVKVPEWEGIESGTANRAGFRLPDPLTRLSKNLPARRERPAEEIVQEACTKYNPLETIFEIFFEPLRGLGGSGFALPQRAEKAAPQRPAIHRMEREIQERQEGMEEQTGGNPWGYQGWIATGTGVVATVGGGW